MPEVRRDCLEALKAGLLLVQTAEARMDGVDLVYEALERNLLSIYEAEDLLDFVEVFYD